MRHRHPQRPKDSEVDPAEHYTRLAEEFGHSRREYRARDEGRPMTGGQLLFQPLSLFIIALLALVLVTAVQMWRVGLFDSVFGDKSAVVDRAPKRWLLNGRAGRIPDDRVIEDGEPEEGTLSTEASNADEDAE